MHEFVLRSAAACALVLASACIRTPPAPPAPPAPTLAPEIARATFDSVWNRIAHTYYDTTFNGLDWTAVRAELAPRAEAATTLPELRTVLSEMLTRLGDSHFGIVAGDAVDALDPGADAAGGDAHPGFELRVIDQQLVVSRVQFRSGAAGSGVRTGWLVERVGERPIGELLARLAELDSTELPVARSALIQRVQQWLLGEAGSRVDVVFRDNDDNVVELSLERTPVAGTAVRFGNLPRLIAHVEHELLENRSGHCYGMVRFNVWFPAISAGFEQAMDEFASCAGVIVDLRGNPGGVAGMIMGTSGFFLDSATPLGVMTTRANQLRFMSNPRRSSSDGATRTPYSGRLAILVDGQSMSTSEFFAAGMQGIGRARVFGEPTPGWALPALMVRLPTGDVLIHAIADYTGPGGVRIEGRGVVPDMVVPLTRAALRAGRDPALEAALAWLQNPGS